MHCPDVNMTKLTNLWNSELRSDQICDVLGISRGRLYFLVRRHRLGRRPPRLSGNGLCKTEDPTPDQIRERAAAIRATWTANERKARVVGGYRGRVEIRHFWFDRENHSFSAGQ